MFRIELEIIRENKEGIQSLEDIEKQEGNQEDKELEIEKDDQIEVERDNQSEVEKDDHKHFN